ncbi:DEAD/DEAH box helicase [Thermophilibacter mediterraneus]|uniref:DEAD/DEAH box helicase n=1 Tax=Thermophilibacter mediterraneus TaxID=1871031 RepID=UPI0009303FD9|nr:DEAD/DEAH box helicase [Thermophilibacter mediterraneus]
MGTELLVERLQEEAALSSTYERGLALARNGSVADADEDTGALGATLSLSAVVRGSRGDAYRVRVLLDLNDAEILDYGCTCPAAQGYPGMCKHEIAAVLDYLSRRGEGPASGGPALATGGRSPGAPAWAAPLPGPRDGAAGPARDRARGLPTSPQILSLMQDVTTRRIRDAEEARLRRELAEGADEGPVELEVTILPAQDGLYLEGTTWCVKLRVRRGAVAYVVKNIASLVDAYQRGETVGYGKRLSFAHVPSAFTESSRAVLEVLSRVVASQRALYRSRWRYREAGRGAEIKELPLADGDVVAVLDALQGRTVLFQANDGPYGTRGAIRHLEVTTDDPQIRTALETASDGGFDLRVLGRWYPFSSERGLYVLDESRAVRCSGDLAARGGALLAQILSSERPMHVSSADMPAFCRDVLPTLRDVSELSAPEGLDELTPPEAAFSFRVGCEDGLVSCDATVAYGTWEHALYGPSAIAGPAPDEPTRDLVAEYHVMDVVEELFPGGDPGAGDLPCFDEADDELLFDLLTRGLARLGELGEVLLSERLRSVRVHASPQLSVRATARSGLLDVRLDASGLSTRDIEAYLAAYRRRQRFVRLSSGDIMRMGESASAAVDLAEGLGVGDAELAEGVSGLPASRALFVDALAKRSAGLDLRRNDGVRAIVRDFDTFADADFEVPERLAGVLRPYQRDGFRWLQTLERFGFGGILADDMGLGKTLQVIAHLLALKEGAPRREGPAGRDGSGVRGSDGGPGGDGTGSGTTLVVCPASLVYNWMSELDRFAPDLDTVAVLGTKAARRATIASAPGHDVLVTSYDLMRRDVEEYERLRFARVVLDEAQYIKNPLTQVARAAKRLPSDVRLALTGTPIENRTSELWSIFDFLMPGLLGGRDAFAKEYEGPVEAGERRATERLRLLVSPFILRRLKTDVLSDLPEKTESVVVARMSGEQEKLYGATQDRLARQIAREEPDEFRRTKLQVLSELTRLRQICCDPALCFEDYGGGSAKLETCLELVSGALDGGHRVLLFSQFTSMLEIISRRLRALGVDHLTLTGSTSREERRRLVARFQSHEAPVFLVSLRAGGVGLNLTAADVVIHYDPWWNLAAQNQATDRAHRIGQERDVTVYKLICADTIEERIVAMQESKRELAEGLLSGEGVRSASLTRDDILALLRT